MLRAPMQTARRLSMRSRSRVRAVTTLVTAALALLVHAAVAGAATPDPRLLATYQPVTYFHPAEPFRPTSVQSFISDADLEQFDGAAWVVADPSPEPGSLPAPGTGVWRLNQDSCAANSPLGGLGCYVAAWEEGRGAPVVYGRVARTGGHVVLQYWYFYYHNVYSYFFPPNDVVWQSHEGDWEVVNVVLSADEEPLFVGYSQHCLGETRSWATTPRWDGTHPVVYVALGSHANDFSAGEHVFDVRCIPVQALGVLAAMGLGIPVDRTAAGDAAGPPRSPGRVSPVRKIDDGHPPWMEFEGFWGELQYFHAAPFGTFLFGTSPPGPADPSRLIWTSPLAALATWTPS
jgi:hypothetical protein